MPGAARQVDSEPVRQLDALEQKLLREITQSEYDAYLHTRRQASRLGESLPSEVCLAVSRHAESTRARLATLMKAKHRRTGLALGSLVGRIFSNLRQYGLDNVIANERSYRATLLGLHHGVDAVQLLRFVALRNGSGDVVTFCEELLAVRAPLLDRGVAALEWFAGHPGTAAR